MSASALLSELQAAGVILAATGDRLKIEAAPGIITPELTARLKALKPELLAILGGTAAANDDNESHNEQTLDLPLLAATKEFDDLIARLCNARRLSVGIRSKMLAARRRMSPDNVLKELSIIRRQVDSGRR